MSLDGTAWVDRNMRSIWPRLRERVPESWLPRVVPGQKKITVEELGCGHYGCVMPTGVPGLVCKLTSDQSEASFVASYLKLGLGPSVDDALGIVHYREIFQLADASHYGRPLYILWRQEAFDLGLLARLSHVRVDSPAVQAAGYMSGQVRSIREGAEQLDMFLKSGRLIRTTLQRLSKRMTDREQRLQAVADAFQKAQYSSLDPKWLKGLPRVGAALEQCRVAAEVIENTDVIYTVGKALGYFLDEGLLLADVHLNNIGRVRDPFEHLVITDPGHVIAVDPRWTHWPGISQL